MLLFIAPKVSELRALNKAVCLASNYFSVMDTLGFGSKTKKSTPGETIGTVEKSYLRTWGWNHRNYSVSFIVQGCFCVCVRALCNTPACWWDDGARLIAKPDICISAHKITHRNINGKQNLKKAKRDRKRLVVRGDKMRSRRVSASWWMRVACQTKQRTHMASLILRPFPVYEFTQQLYLPTNCVQTSVVIDCMTFDN